MSRKFRILSIDGGGLRGIIPLQFIKEIEDITGQPIHKTFDLIAGTSTGGLLTSALTLQDNNSIEADTRRYTLEEIEKIYLNKGKLIFPPKKWFSRKKSKLTKLFNPEFNAKNFNDILINYFANERISNCLRPIFITSYNVHRNIPIFFTSRDALTSLDKNVKLIEVCRATSAAPTYFPTYEFNYNTENLMCIDGGVIMNNPSLGALVEVLGNKDYKFYKLEDKILSLEDICVLSLGTGYCSNLMNVNKMKNWGTLSWIRPIIDISLEGASKIAHKQISTIFKASGAEKNYLRLDIDIERKYSEMSDAREETLNYLKNETISQINTNHTLVNSLKTFLVNSGLDLEK
ncbi:patatin-like phospholipase family protein [Elizabethkingia sp. M8]|uniref:patatin-like phospholipase family protein n=1 Tax=Elizabethkingia sp. M8 TaxID=2796140 RepID=UPI001907CA73|nr:patatin-like phospholipase family protein [Elizabethkingia sp. M8]QQM28270.1 patatin-like phospholipase family protein [Elizabethkingia sp. M8]